MNDLSRGETVLLIVLIWTTWIIFYWAGKNNLLGYMSDTISDFGKQLSESMRKTEEVKITKSEQDRLIELLSRYFAIGDSYAYNLTRVKEAFEVGTVTLDDFVEFDDEVVADIADHLIANGVIVPPVKVGQTVYLIRRPFHHPAFISDEVVERVKIEYTKQGVLRKFDNRYFDAYDINLGETVFLTREEAEQALKERSDGNV